MSIMFWQQISFREDKYDLTEIPIPLVQQKQCAERGIANEPKIYVKNGPHEVEMASFLHDLSNQR